MAVYQKDSSKKNMFDDEGFVNRYLIFVPLLALMIGAVAVFWLNFKENQKIIRDISLTETRQFLDNVVSFKQFYTSEIFHKAREKGMEIPFSDIEAGDSIPVPATLAANYGEYLLDQGQGYRVRMFSDIPIPWLLNEAAPVDDFERAALQAIRENPDKPYWVFDNVNGVPHVRYAVADVLGRRCAKFNNQYPGSSKTDWKKGDVRGVVAVSRPLSAFQGQVKSSMENSLVLLLLLLLSMSSVLFFALRGVRKSLSDVRSVNQRLQEEIAERSQLTSALQTSHIKTHTIINSVVDAIVVINDRGVIIETNQAVEAVFGYHSDEVIGQNVSMLMGSEHATQHDQYIARYITRGKSNIMGKALELQARRKDGRLIPIELSVDKAEIDETVIFTGIIRDISERLKIQEQLAKARDAALDSLRMKSEFLANMSHEIRTPMNGVLGMTQMMMDTPLSPEQRDYANTIKSSADSLLHIINDILDFSKIEAGKLEIRAREFELQPLLEDVIELMGALSFKKNIELALFVSEDVPERVISDALRLRQVLINLLNNAIKFTSEGYVILKVSVENGCEESLCLRFDVEDTGMGISAEGKKRLFRPFSQVDGSTTRRYGGTGLGLAISAQLAELMGGSIGVRSVEGNGSVFWFRVALVIPEATIHKIVFKNKSVLWQCSGHAELQRLHVEQLRSWGVNCHCQRDFDSVLDVLRATPEQVFSLVVLEVKDESFERMHKCIEYVRAVSALPIVMHGSLRALKKVRALKRMMPDVHCLPKPMSHRVLRRLLVQMDALPEEKQLTSGVVSDIVVPLSKDMVGTGSAHSIRLLLTEDHLVNQKVALALLRRAGYTQVDCALNGKEALAALEKTHYDLILMDCQMPEMDGYEATRRIRAMKGEYYQQLPIVALTANAMKGDDDKCFAAGMSDYLSKPVSGDALKQVLEKWLPETAVVDV